MSCPAIVGEKVHEQVGYYEFVHDFQGSTERIMGGAYHRLAKEMNFC